MGFVFAIVDPNANWPEKVLHTARLRTWVLRSIDAIVIGQQALPGGQDLPEMCLGSILFPSDLDNTTYQRSPDHLSMTHLDGQHLPTFPPDLEEYMLQPTPHVFIPLRPNVRRVFYLLKIKRGGIPIISRQFSRRDLLSIITVERGDPLLGASSIESGVFLISTTTTTIQSAQDVFETVRASPDVEMVLVFIER